MGSDLVLWSVQQADVLRRMAAGERVNHAVDWERIAEEIEALGRRDRRELRNRIRIILVHLLKLQTSPSAAPRAGWRETVVEQRAAIRALLDDSPSLRAEVPTLIAEEIAGARDQAMLSLSDHGETPTVDPGSLFYDAEQTIGAWLP